MHVSPAVRLGCTDCHGGQRRHHRQTRRPHRSRATLRCGARQRILSRSYAQLNQERPEFVRFVNPGDLRVADQILRHMTLPRRDRRQGAHQPDVAWRVPVGRGALQQRRHSR